MILSVEHTLRSFGVNSVYCSFDLIFFRGGDFSFFTFFSFGGGGGGDTFFFIN